VATFRCTLVYTGADERSHFADIEIPMDKIATGDRTAPIAATGTLFRSGDGKASYEELHPAPQRQFVFCLKGSFEIECGDATKRQFHAGDVFLVDDTTGEGHRFRELSGPTLMSWVMVPTDVDINAWRV
jgi:hypothetical protein